MDVGPPTSCTCLEIVMTSFLHFCHGVPSQNHVAMQAFMQRPVYPSYGRVKQNMDGCLFVWTGKKQFIFIFLF